MHERHPRPTPAHRCPAATACPRGSRRCLATVPTNLTLKIWHAGFCLCGSSLQGTPACPLQRLPGTRSGLARKRLPARHARRVAESRRGRRHGHAGLPGRGRGFSGWGFSGRGGDSRRGWTGGGVVVVLDRTGEFYPLAAIAHGIEPGRLIVVHPRQQGRPHLGLGPGIALSGRGRGRRLAGNTRRKTRRADLPPITTGRGARWRPGFVDPAGKRVFPALLGRRAVAGRTTAEHLTLWPAAADTRCALALPRRRAPCTQVGANRGSGDRSWGWVLGLRS